MSRSCGTTRTVRPDANFGTNGVVDAGLGGARALALGPHGTIVIAGFAGDPDDNAALWRLTPAGAPDTSFHGTGTLHAGTVDEPSFQDVAVRSDGAIVVAGFDAGAGTISRLLPNGNFDHSFAGTGTAAFTIEPKYTLFNALAVQPDGRIVAVGGTGGGKEDFAVVRANSDGTPDTTFGGGDGEASRSLTPGIDQAWSVVVEPSGRIVASGVTDPGGTFAFGMAGFVGDAGPDCSLFGTDTPTC